MAGEIAANLVGNLTGDPELRFTPSGAAVANFTVAQTPRFWDKLTNAYKDGETVFANCGVWRESAENVAESLHKGDRVVVTGTWVQRSYMTRETPEVPSVKRTVMEVRVDEVGPSLRYARCVVARRSRQVDPRGAHTSDPIDLPARSDWSVAANATPVGSEPF